MGNINTNKDFAAELNSFRDSVSDIKNDIKYTKMNDFQILTSAIHSLMKFNDFTSMELKDSSGVSADKAKVEKHLKEKFNIIDNESAMQSIGMASIRGTHWQYAQFDIFEDEKFQEEFNKLAPAGKENFIKCKEFADLFKPAVGKGGFFAWDIALGVDIIRECVFCDFFNEPTARKMMDDLMKPLLSTYDNWVDFAVSFIAGGTYSTYKNSRYNIEEAEGVFDNLLELAERMFKDESVNVWKVYSWYKKKEYFPTLNKDDLKMLVKSEKACFVSDRISVDGAKPCYVYREKPFNNFPDSGWRFFAGDESKEYSADIENSHIFPLNVIANFDETIIPLLEAEVNTAFIRKQGEDFINFKTASDAMKKRSEEDPII